MANTIKLSIVGGETLVEFKDAGGVVYRAESIVDGRTLSADVNTNAVWVHPIPGAAGFHIPFGELENPLVATDVFDLLKKIKESSFFVDGGTGGGGGGTVGGALATKQDELKVSTDAIKTALDASTALSTTERTAIQTKLDEIKAADVTSANARDAKIDELKVLLGTIDTDTSGILTAVDGLETVNTEIKDAILADATKQQEILTMNTNIRDLIIQTNVLLGALRGVIVEKQTVNLVADTWLPVTAGGTIVDIELWVNKAKVVVEANNLNSNTVDVRYSADVTGAELYIVREV